MEQEHLDNEEEMMEEEMYQTSYSEETEEYISSNSTDSYDEVEDEEDEEILSQIYLENYDLIEGEKTDGKYYIGLPAYNTLTKQIVLMNVVCPFSFFNHSLKDVLNYLTTYSIIMTRCQKIHIIKLHINPLDETYNAILKTHWLRIIQKKWKKIMKERKHIIDKRKTLFSILYFEKHGRYPNGLNYFPSLQGMLSNLCVFNSK